MLIARLFRCSRKLQMRTRCTLLLLRIAAWLSVFQQVLTTGFCLSCKPTLVPLPL